MKRKFTFLIAAAVMLLTMMATTAMWGQTRGDEVYSTCLFGGTHGTNSNYTSTWTATNGNFSWSVANGNTNGSNWNYVKFGRKNVESVGTITTTSAYTEAITKVDVTIDAITTNSVNSIKLYTSSNGSSWTEAGTFTKSTGTKSVSLSSPVANLYYKIEFDCASGSANGLVSVSKVEYYHSTGGNPTCVTPTFDPEAGTYTSAQNVMISTTTEGATIYYTLDGSDPTTSSAVYSSAISVSATMTIKAMATADGYDNSSIASATYTIVNIEHAGTIEDPYTIADARTAIDANVGVNGVYATGIVSAIVTAYGTGGYNNVTFNMVDEAGDEVFLQAFRCVGDDAPNVLVNDVVVVSGNLTKYGQTYEFAQGCQVVSLEHPIVTEPTITVTPATVNVSAEGEEGTLSVTYDNINEVVAEVYFCDAQGGTATYDWITAEINSDKNVYYIIDANDGEARTAYLKVYALDDNAENVYSNLVTINQDEYVAPTYATLPFAFNGGKADIENTDGLTQEGLGSDYNATSIPTTKLKFDGSGDWLLLQFSERPGTLTFDIKGNSFSGSTFKVQTSEDGITYTDLETYTELGDTQDESFDNLDENVRYIKWIYTEKVNGNVGLGNIALAEYVAPVASITVDPTLVEVDAAEHEGYIGIAYQNLTINQASDFGIQFYDSEDHELNGNAEPDWVTAEPTTQSGEEGYFVYYLIEENDDEARTAYFKVWALDDTEPVYSNLVTVSQAAPVVLPPVINAEDIEIAYDATSGVIDYTIDNPDTGVSLSANSDDDWISDITISESQVSFTTTVNEGNADRIGTITLSYTGAEDKAVTVTQGHHVVDYATLPFEWEGGPRSEFEALNGTSTYSVGDYGDNQGVYRMKLDGTDDYIQVKTNEQPGIVTIGVKMIGGASTSTITVQGSADGTTFTNVEDLTISGAQNSIHTLETTNDFAATDRYVRLYFNKGSNVGVGPISIAQVDLTPSIAITSPEEFDCNAHSNEELAVTYKNIDLTKTISIAFFESDGETSATYDWITSATINDDHNVVYSIAANTGAARTAYFKVIGKTSEDVDVPSNLVTVSQAAYVAPDATITYHKNGLTSTAGVSTGLIELPQSDVYINGYTFVGWAEAEISGVSQSATYFMTYDVTGNVDLYAVYAIETIEQQLTSKLTAGTYVIATKPSDKYIVFAGQEGSNTYGSGVTANDGITSSICRNYAITIAVTENGYSMQYGDKYLGWTSGNTLAFDPEFSETRNEWSFEIDNGNMNIISKVDSNRKLQWNASSPRFACYATAQTPVMMFKYSLSDFCTTITAPSVPTNPSHVMTENYTIQADPNGTAYTIPNDNPIIVPSGLTLTVEGTLANAFSSLLTIEDGGQVIVHNPGVQATVKKTIADPSKSADNWYIIASPVNSVTPAGVTNLISNDNPGFDYDLYLYNEPTAQWLNHKKAANATIFANLENGRGYLYWNNIGADLEFDGGINASDVTIGLTRTDGALPGINLIGNPFTHNIYKGTGGAIDNDYLSVGYYTIENGSDWTAKLGHDKPIKPGQGILVETSQAFDLTIANSNTPATSKANQDFIEFTIANSNYEDMAYALFDKAIGLSKIDHRNADIPMVYIPQDGKNYAIATMGDDTEMFNLNFKAMTTGQYTLRVDTKGNYNFLHVYDKLTGMDIDMLVEEEYKFIGSPRDAENRFIVRLNYNANIDELTTNDIFAYQNGDDIIVNGNGELHVYDVMGRFVAKYNVNGKQTIAKPATTGVYILKMFGNDVKTQKIVVR